MANINFDTRLKEVVQNNNLPILGAIRTKIKVVNTGVEVKLNNNPYLYAFASTPTGSATIVGNGTTAFKAGGKTALLSSRPIIVLGAVDEEFTLIVEDKDIINGLSFNFAQYAASVDFNVLSIDYKLSKLPSLQYVQMKGSLVDSIINSLPESIINFKLYGDDTPAINLSTIFDADLHNCNAFEYTNAIGSTTIEKIVESNVGTNAWASILLPVSAAGKITGDIGDIPSDVSRVNTNNAAGGYYCTLGKRNTTSSKIIIGIIRLLTNEDVDNFLINQSGCALGIADALNLWVPGTYTPSATAQTAITTLYGKGVTSIKCNGTVLNSI